METTRKLKVNNPFLSESAITWVFESEFDFNSELASDVTDELFVGILAEYGESQTVFCGFKQCVNWKMEGF